MGTKNILMIEKKDARGNGTGILTCPLHKSPEKNAWQPCFCTYCWHKDHDKIIYANPQSGRGLTISCNECGVHADLEAVGCSLSCQESTLTNHQLALMDDKVGEAHV